MRLWGLVLGLGVVMACGGPGSESDRETEPPSDIAGRWDVTVQTADGSYPSWFEINRAGEGYEGQFVGRVGSARPIPEIEYQEGMLRFSLPVQYESHPGDMTFEGEVQDGQLSGTTNAPDGSSLSWTAAPAPELPAPEDVSWGEPIELFNGTDLSGWKPRHPDVANNWAAEDGVLANRQRGADLVTEQSFRDFRLQLEFQYPEGSNSGIYLRGRYEVQIQDDYGKEPASRHIGGVYGFLTPTTNAARPAGEWQSYDITLLGRYVTIVLNGETIIDNREIPGITGGALDSREGEPGPIMLQGDHGPISFRNILLTPAE